MLANVFVVVKRNWELLLAEEGICTKIMRQERIFEIIVLCLKGEVVGDKKREDSHDVDSVRTFKLCEVLWSLS